MLHTTDSTILISLLDTRGPTPSNLSLLMRRKSPSYHHSHPSGWLIWKVSKWHERERTWWALVSVSYPANAQCIQILPESKGPRVSLPPLLSDRHDKLPLSLLSHWPKTLSTQHPMLMRLHVVHWKTSHTLKIELYFVRKKFLGLQALDTASQVTLKELLQGGGGRSQVIQKFYNKGQIALNIKCIHA